eukprot:TRINITY_DN39976_c0_g1_i1.p1 TRINITY_DN39976_c0_g1~~TRINITY_DN39976_c0_g1_i1.p1  ORF type:complete len:555 (+),score=86.22 TRINITY_DN39976_c0_g1_i1:89-1753(+)
MATYGTNEDLKGEAAKLGNSEEDALLIEKHISNEPGAEGLLQDSNFGVLGSTFGHKLLVLLFVHQHIQKGFLSSWKGSAVPYLYKEYHVQGPLIQIYGGVAGLPWAMKPIIGLLSDLVPIFGYNKAPYVALSSIVGIGACFAIGLSTPGMLPLIGLVACFFCAQFQASTCDLLTEAKYAEKIQAHPSQGSSLMTFVWFGMHFGALVGVAMTGHMISVYGPRAMYLSAGIILLLVFIPIGLGMWEEKKQTSEAVAAAREKALKQPEAMFLCLVMLCGTLVMTCTGLFFKDAHLNCMVGMLVFGVVLTSFSLTLSPMIARVNGFALIQHASSLPIGGAAFYFYTDSVKEYPEGPHFDPYFYNTVLGTASAVCSLLGIAFYQRYMSKWRYRSMIMFTNIVLSLLCLSDAILFSRVNLKYGIPDKFLLLGSSCMETVVFQWMWMPSVLVTSYLCPKGMEATMYALLAGCANLGNSISANNGALLLSMLGCRPTGQVGDAAQFENLWWASLVGIIVSFITTIFTVKLFPDARQNEKLLEGDELQDPCAGSFLRRWRGLE